MRTSSRRPPVSVRPSTISKLSSSARPPPRRGGTSLEAEAGGGSVGRHQELRGARGCGRSFVPTAPPRGRAPRARCGWPGLRTRPDRSSPSVCGADGGRGPRSPRPSAGPAPRSADDRASRHDPRPDRRHVGTTTARWRGSPHAPVRPLASMPRPEPPQRSCIASAPVAQGLFTHRLVLQGLPQASQ